MDTNDYVAKLNLYSQKIRAGVTYEDVKATGPDHIKTFVIRAIVNGVPYPDGEGKRKKEAKQNAAKNALKGLLPDPEESRENPSETSVTSTEHGPMSDYVSWLNKYGHKHKLSVNYIPSTCLNPNTLQQYTLGNTEYEAATGTTKKEAKQAAAKKAYDILSSPQTNTSFEAAGRASPQSADNSMSEICSGMNNVSLASDNGSFMVFNYNEKLQGYCQRKRLELKFINEQQTGPPHNQRFFVKAVIGDSEYPVGEGGNSKEAKQNAARLACNALDQQSKSESTETSSGFGSPIGSSTPQRTMGTDTHTDLDMGSSILFTDNPPPPKDEHPVVRRKTSLSMDSCLDSQKSEPKNKRLDLEGKTSIENKQINSRFEANFDSIKSIGKGGFARVFKARHKLVNKDYAIKNVAYKDDKTLKEAKALSELSHKNIVMYLDCWAEDTRYHSDSSSDSSSHSTGAIKYLYIQMELCKKTLREWIDDKNDNKPSQDPTRRVESLEIALQIISGVEYFHSKKFIHRDLKPENIMFGQNEEVRIVDFGLVTDEIDDDSENQHERTKRKGTKSYMAPEQGGEASYNRKVDIFSLGLIYFELFWRPSTRQEKSAIWKDVRRQELPQEFSTSFEQESKVIKSMLSQEPEDRPEASEVMELLKKRQELD